MAFQDFKSLAPAQSEDQKSESGSCLSPGGPSLVSLGEMETQVSQSPLQDPISRDISPPSV